MIRILFIIIIITRFYDLTFAQKTNNFSNRLFFETTYLYGKILPHKPSISTLIDKPLEGFELACIYQTNNNKTWHKYFGIPRLGVKYNRLVMSNLKVLGIANTINYFIDANLLNFSRYNLFCEIGTGVTILSKPYHEVDNIENEAIGSYGNFNFTAGLGNTIKLSKLLFLKFGVSLNHFSNGNFYKPNSGLNYVLYNFGLKIKFNATEIEIAEPPIDKTSKNYFAVIGYFGGKRLQPTDKNLYGACSFSAVYERKIANIWSLGCGGDIFYDSSAKLKKDKTDSNFEQSFYYSSGFHISQMLIIGRFSVGLHEGLFLFLPDKINEHKMYNRCIFKYKFAKHWLISTAVKSHLAVADYVEWGVGYYW